LTVPVLVYAVFSPTGLVVYLSVNIAVMTKFDCSFKCNFLLPSDGDAMVLLPIYAGRTSLPLITLDAVIIRSCTYCQHPIFFGSSCAHTTSAFGYFAICSATKSKGNGAICSIVMTATLSVPREPSLR